MIFGVLGPMVSYLIFALAVFTVTVANDPSTAQTGLHQVLGFLTRVGPIIVLFPPAALLALLAAALSARPGRTPQGRWGWRLAAMTLLGIVQLLIGLLVFDSPITALATGLVSGAAALAICSSVAELSSPRPVR
jgi:hypothetical protein